MSIGDHINFWGIQDDKLIYDERKKRFVQTAEMPRHLQRQIRGNSFKHVSIFCLPSAPGVLPLLSKDTLSLAIEP